MVIESARDKQRSGVIDQLSGPADIAVSLPVDRQAGAWLHISSLPSPFGIGDIGLVAHEFIQMMSAMDLRVWQFLPLGPVGYGNSPYQPLSIFAGSEMLIGIDSLIRDGFVDEQETRELSALPKDQTHYAALIPLKTRLLDTAAGRFSERASTSQRQSFEQFVAQHDSSWLHSYAQFRVLKLMHDEKAWPRWAPQYVRRDSNALRSLDESAAAAIHNYKVQQFWFHSQWLELRQVARENRISLMGDVPIYIALDSADAWVGPELLEIDSEGNPTCVAGVPPDYFSADGQLWGNPVYDWQYHARDGYTWWVDRIRTAFRQVDMIRLDHFRGFESYWAVPSDAETARDGKWRQGPADDLFRVLKNELGELPLIAEDLGIITDEVRAFLSRWNFPGMKVLQFMVDDEHFNPDSIIHNSVCYTGTHDNDTTVGWFRNGLAEGASGDELARRKAIVLANIGGKAESIHLDMIRFALASSARLCMIPVQDLLGLDSDSRMNTPGTTDKNWCWRLPDLDTLRCGKFATNLREWIAASGRAGSASEPEGN